jgi:hypothetical protein
MQWIRVLPVNRREKATSSGKTLAGIALALDTLLLLWVALAVLPKVFR